MPVRVVRQCRVAITYDRRIRPGLEDVLLPGGVAHGLVQRHRGDPGRVDLHLRAYPGEARNWATLYCGLTKPLDLIETRGKYRLRADPTWQQFAPDLPWNAALDVRGLARAWPRVEAYLDVVLTAIEGTRWFGKEGVVQTAVTRLVHDGMTVFDREAVPAFTDTPEKDRVMREEASLLTSGLTGDETWWTVPTLGEECDAAALDRHGRLLAVEVKPASAKAKSIAFAPLQAAYYARLFSRWVENDACHAANIDGLIAQRLRLGLSSGAGARAARPLHVIPVVIIGGGLPSTEVLRRCRVVRSRLLAAGVIRELQLWSLDKGVLTDLVP